MSNVNDNNDNNGSITWDDVVAMEDAARDLKEVPAPLLLIYFVQARKMSSGLKTPRIWNFSEYIGLANRRATMETAAEPS